jgi:pimeloyl-ACP methyl ester carboxylesterase
VDINTARHGIIKNARGFLLNFYRDCFAAEEKENYHWFKQTLQKVYLEKFNREPLLSSLAKLENSALDSRALAEIKNLTFIHGQDDKIAPVEEIKEFAKTLPQAHCHLIENCGHLPFLRGEFAAIFTRYTQTKP